MQIHHNNYSVFINLFSQPVTVERPTGGAPQLQGEH